MKLYIHQQDTIIKEALFKEDLTPREKAIFNEGKKGGMLLGILFGGLTAAALVFVLMH